MGRFCFVEPPICAARVAPRVRGWRSDGSVFYYSAAAINCQ